jgi:hypothetical protein
MTEICRVVVRRRARRAFLVSDARCTADCRPIRAVCDEFAGFGGVDGPGGYVGLLEERYRGRGEGFGGGGGGGGGE